MPEHLSNEFPSAWVRLVLASLEYSLHSWLQSPAAPCLALLLLQAARYWSKCPRQGRLVAQLLCCSWAYSLPPTEYSIALCKVLKPMEKAFESIPCTDIPSSGQGVDLFSKSHWCSWNLNSGPPCLGCESYFFKGKQQKLLIPLPVERKVSSS